MSAGTIFYNYDFQCYCHYGINALLSAEASHHMTSRAQLIQGTWTSPVTNRLLVAAAVSRYYQVLPRDQEPDALESSVLEQSTGLRSRSQVGYARNDGIIDHYRASVSYVSGAHALKIGMEVEHQWANDADHNIGAKSYRSCFWERGLTPYRGFLFRSR